jgi:hypothetical protein
MSEVLIASEKADATLATCESGLVHRSYHVDKAGFAFKISFNAAFESVEARRNWS